MPTQIAGDQVERRAQQALAYIKGMGMSLPPVPKADATMDQQSLSALAASRTKPSNWIRARATQPLKVFMVHGIGHGDDPAKADWKTLWQEAFGRSAVTAGYGGKIEYEFANFDSVFDQFPLDEVIIGRGLLTLVQGVLGPAPTFGATRELAQRNLKDTLLWTAGMVIQWVESEALRSALRATLLEQMRAFDGDMVCAHSLGTLACYDVFRQEVVSGQASQFDRKQLLTFGSQIAHPAVQKVFGGRIEPLVDRAGHGFDQW
jgi:hypothetical protein